MSRTPGNFGEMFAAMVTASNQTLAQVTATAVLETKLLAIFNRIYKRGYDRWPWEDAWTGVTVTPVSRLIDFSVIDEAMRFEVWTADPRRPENCAVPLRYTTTADGLTLLLDATTAYVLRMPKAPKFTRTAWVTATPYAVNDLVLYTDGNVYRCVEAHTSSAAFATDAAKWVVVPVLAVLEAFMEEYGSGTYLLETGQLQTGAARRNDALDALERLQQAEHFRLATAAWRPNQQR